MYEAELNRVIEPIASLPLGAVRQFAEFTGQIQGRTNLPWGEHCTECNWPTCYTTCELYSPREDRGCRLFVDGVGRIDYPDGPNPYLLKIRFKRWGKLWTVGNLNLRTLEEAAKKEKTNMAVGALARALPLPGPLKARVLRKVGYRRRRSAEQAQPTPDLPDCFLVECYNPNPRTINLSLTVRHRNRQTTHAFQQMISVSPGFVREQIPFSEIARHIDLKQAFELEIVPNDCDGTVLYFGLVDFVKLRSRPSRERLVPSDGRKWKCIVWDLDNTLWDGVLIEDGPERIRLRQGVADVIKETDRRGILHSIASKNSHDDAMKILRMCGLDDLFLHPQINWAPKSQSIARIAQLLNIGVDTLAFVDDQPFEREEVKAALPQVEVIDAADFAGIPEREECIVPVTEESRQRRLMYRQQHQRNATLEAHGGDYLGFLKACDIRLNIVPLNDENLERVYELAQRTNQMNFSGNRYPRSQLQEIRQSKHHETCVIHCTDRFGNYGIVGFAVVDVREPRLVDLMFSCRIQSKRVEHAFLGFLLNRFVRDRSRDFIANYRKSPKNAAAGKVFEDLGFETAQETDGVLSLAFRKDRPIPNDGIITINENGVKTE